MGKPAGGYDATELKPTSQPTYTLKITFHKATNLPIADYGSRSSDPFVLARAASANVYTRHPQDPPLQFRTPTHRRTTEPVWDSVWILAGVPASGVSLTLKVFDEDPGNHDDKLGSVVLDTGPLQSGFKLDSKTFVLKKRGASWRAWGPRSCLSLVSSTRKLNAQLVVSIAVISRTEKEVGKLYTVNNFYWVHFSPLIGRLTGTKASGSDGVEKFNFQANELQLRGPVPNELYHRFVDFKPFVHGMFEGSGLRGRLLHKALHHQHERIYNFDKMTLRGEFDKPCEDMTLQFLDMVHYDSGGRIFTYVITLDGLFRFTETGKEFGIDLLSKHTMHSDVNIYIAYSGEFLIRRFAHPESDAEAPDQRTHAPDPLPGGPPHAPPPHDPRSYQLVIDNDSGTYRPESSLLPVLKKFLKTNLPGLRILALACDDPRSSRIKDEQRKTKEHEGDPRVFGQASSVGSDSGDEGGGSVSSSDEEHLEERARGRESKSAIERGVEFLEHPSQVGRDLVKEAKSEAGSKLMKV